MSPRLSVSRRAFLETLAATGAFGLAASLTDGWIVHAQTAAVGAVCAQRVLRDRRHAAW